MPIDSHTHEAFLVVIVFFVCFGVTIALLMLGSWNMYLISRGETAIEFYTNQREYYEMKRLGKVLSDNSLFMSVCVFVCVSNE